MHDTDDIPATSPKFDYDRIAETLTRLLQRKRLGSFVLGLHGPWGSGKTTLLNAIRDKLPEFSIVINFNAWKYQDRESLWRALILRVLAKLRTEGGDPARIEQLERSLYEGFTVEDRGPLRVNWSAAVTEAALLVVNLVAAGLTGGLLGNLGEKLGKFFGLGSDKEKGEDVAKRIERIGGILQRTTIERSIHRVVSIEQFLKVFRELTAQLGTARRIYVLIDDLDRCLPESALEIFEATKLFLDAPECAYVIAVDRAIIRRGLELRYPARTGDLAPALIDPDEYIEKTISLSFDLPMLADSDAQAIIETMEVPVALTPDQLKNVTSAIGTNPRRLKRFSATIGVWLELAQELQLAGRELRFSPLDEAKRDLFLKLALIGYANSDVIAHMQRDGGLAERLQKVCNAALGQSGEAARELVKDKTKNELLAIRQAALDPGLWRIFALPPNLANEPTLPVALRWFRSAAS
jgi:hypothetical protein